MLKLCGQTLLWVYVRVFLGVTNLKLVGHRTSLVVLVIKAPHFLCRKQGFNPGFGNQDHMLCYLAEKRKKKRKRKKKKLVI